MTEPPSVTLANGMHAEIRRDRWSDHGLELVVDGTPQSHIHPDDPTVLFYEYVQRMGTATDLLGMPGQPITALHLGAGALTLPRYVHATRPGSRQQVLELERELVDLVRAAAPWPKQAGIRVRYGDARELLGRLPEALTGACDLVVVDVFGGARTPAHVTSAEFYGEVARFLAPDGLVLVNVADGSGAAFARGQAATLRYVLDDVAVVSEQQVLKGRRFGNFVLLGARAKLPDAWLRRMLAGGPHPAGLVHGRELVEWIGSAPLVTDATATPSPSPNRSIFQLSRGAAEELERSREAASERAARDGAPG